MEKKQIEILMAPHVSGEFDVSKIQKEVAKAVKANMENGAKVHRSQVTGDPESIILTFPSNTGQAELNTAVAAINNIDNVLDALLFPQKSLFVFDADTPGDAKYGDAFLKDVTPADRAADADGLGGEFEVRFVNIPSGAFAAKYIVSGNTFGFGGGAGDKALYALSSSNVGQVFPQGGGNEIRLHLQTNQTFLFATQNGYDRIRDFSWRAKYQHPTTVDGSATGLGKGALGNSARVASRNIAHNAEVRYDKNFTTNNWHLIAFDTPTGNCPTVMEDTGIARTAFIDVEWGKRKDGSEFCKVRDPNAADPEAVINSVDFVDSQADSYSSIRMFNEVSNTDIGPAPQPLFISEPMYIDDIQVCVNEGLLL